MTVNNYASAAYYNMFMTSLEDYERMIKCGGRGEVVDRDFEQGYFTKPLYRIREAK